MNLKLMLGRLIHAVAGTLILAGGVSGHTHLNEAVARHDLPGMGHVPGGGDFAAVIAGMRQSAGESRSNLVGGRRAAGVIRVSWFRGLKTVVIAQEARCIKGETLAYLRAIAHFKVVKPLSLSTGRTAYPDASEPAAIALTRRYL